MYRSILEAVAMTLKKYVDDMCGEIGVRLNELIITGGGSNSDVFMQIFADVFGLPAVRNEINSSAGVGAAICAAAAIGAYHSIGEATANMVRRKDTFLPVPENEAIYRQLLPVYLDITNHTDAVLKKTYPIFS